MHGALKPRTGKVKGDMQGISAKQAVERHGLRDAFPFLALSLVKRCVEKGSCCYSLQLRLVLVWGPKRFDDAGPTDFCSVTVCTSAVKIRKIQIQSCFSSAIGPGSQRTDPSKL